MTETTTTTPIATEADTARARDLATRWDAQQTAYIRHRAERFATIARVVADVCAETTAPRILDLAGGTGALAEAVLAAVPGATAVVADKDPALLAIAADLAAADRRLVIAEVDLADRRWAEHPAIADAPFDAVVSSTALHWLQPGTLVDVHRRTADLLRAGGILLNGDHLSYQRDESTLAAIAARDDAVTQRDGFAAGADTWDAWWAAVAETPRYAEAIARRDAVWGAELHEAPPKVTLGFHIESLRSAGFAEVGTVWQYLDDHVVYGVR